MGQISDDFIERPCRGRKLADELRREAGSIQAALGVALDPLHAVHVAVQDVTSAFAERASRFPEFRPYYQSAPGPMTSPCRAAFLTGLPDVRGSLPHA